MSESKYFLAYTPLEVCKEIDTVVNGKKKVVDAAFEYCGMICVLYHEEV